MLGYLTRLSDRMQKRAWQASDPAYVAAWKAQDALHELCVRLRYQACGNPGSRGGGPQRGVGTIAAMPLALRITIAIAVVTLLAAGLVQGDSAAVAFVILPAALAGLLGWDLIDRPNARRRRRLRNGQCIRCGYDLTGNVSGVCPECGKPA
jgi:hypothetical protein